MHYANDVIVAGAGGAPGGLHQHFGKASNGCGGGIVATGTGGGLYPESGSENNSHNCSMNAMVICQKCGACCHDDCISSSKLCGSCVTIR